MLHNYHTHTWRCKHASGKEREYIENAIQRGFQTLGFSDHAPWPIPGGDDCYRMLPSQAEEYCTTLAALREEYKRDIDIKIGFEAEYFPGWFDSLIELITPLPFDYLILGQHRSGNEIGFTHNTRPTDDERDLALYTSQILAGLYTGKFTYLAHPDVLRYTGVDATYRMYMLPFCRAIKKMGIPVEFNFLGFTTGRHYPSERFFKIAAEVGCDVICGIDAHDPAAILDTEAETRALAYLADLGITPVESVTLRDPRG